MKEIKRFGIRINPLKRSDFLEVIRSNIKSGKQIVQVGVNSATVNDLVRDEELRRAINNADLVHIDGMSVVWALRSLGHQVPERVATPDLADDVLKMAEIENFSIFLLGAKASILELCKANIEETFPNLRIVGFHDGYYKPEEEASIISMINNAQPDILLIGMSSPQKELLYEKYRDTLNTKYTLGVGGYFDIVSGNLKRAPKWMQNIGMEWFYRFIQEPRRMWRRYLIGINQFFLIVLKLKLKKEDS